MSKRGGSLFRSNLQVTCQPDENCESRGHPSPEDDEHGDTESVDSSDGSVSMLSQFTPPHSLKRENARQSRSPVNSRSKDVSEWDVADVKAWVMERFASETIANNFEKEEVDGCILLSATVRSNEAMETLGLTTIGKKGKFLDETLKLTGACTGNKKSKLEDDVSPTDYSLLDRILTNAEKNQLKSMDRSIYNTKKKKITNYVKKIWPPELPAPRFRNNPGTTKQMLEVVETLSNDNEYTFPDAGLGRSAIMDIIRKHMDERRRKDTELKRNGFSSQSETDTSPHSTPSGSASSSDSDNKHKAMKVDHYFNAELTLSSAEAVLLVWLGKPTIHEVKLDKDLKPLAKEFGLKFLRNQDKNTHIRAISSTLIKRQLVKVTTPLSNVLRENVHLVSE